MALTVDEELELIDILDAEEADKKKTAPPSQRDASFQRPEEKTSNSTWEGVKGALGAISNPFKKGIESGRGSFLGNIAENAKGMFVEPLKPIIPLLKGDILGAAKQGGQYGYNALKGMVNLPIDLTKYGADVLGRASTGELSIPNAASEVLQKGTQFSYENPLTALLLGKTVAPKTVGALIEKPVGKVLSTAGNVASKAKNFVLPSDEYIANKRYNDLSTLNLSYSDLRELVDKNKRLGLDPAKSLSGTDILNYLDIGPDRIIDATRAYELFDRYMEPISGLKQKVLNKEAISAYPENILNSLRDYIKNKSVLSGENRLSALSGAKREIEGLRFKSNQGGQIPLSELELARNLKGKKINYRDPEANAVQKTLSKAMEDYIINNSTENIAKINKDLQPLMAMKEYIESLHGKRIDKGKLGKYGVKILSSIIGGASGGTLGALTSVLGTDAILNQFAKNKFGNISLGKGINIPESLLRAASEANSPRHIAGLLPSKTGISIPGAIQQPTNLESINSALSNLESTKVPVNVKDVINYDNPYASIAPRLALPSPESVSTAVPRINQFTNLEAINQALENLKRTNITPKIKTKLDYGNRYADVYARLGLPSPENVSTTLPPINQFTNLEFINEALNNLKKAKVSGVKDIVNKKQTLTEAEKNFQRFLKEMKNFRTTNLIA